MCRQWQIAITYKSSSCKDRNRESIHTLGHTTSGNGCVLPPPYELVSVRKTLFSNGLWPEEPRDSGRLGAGGGGGGGSEPLYMLPAISRQRINHEQHKPITEELVAQGFPHLCPLGPFIVPVQAGGGGGSDHVRQSLTGGGVCSVHTGQGKGKAPPQQTKGLLGESK